MKARIPGAQAGGQRNMMKQIQQMQAELEAKQAEIEQTEFSASAGGGAVTVTVTGAHEIRNIELKPEVVDPEDVEMLSDLIIAAANEAMKKAEDAMEQAMGAVKGALGGMGLPF